MCRPPRILAKVVGTFHVPSTFSRWAIAPVFQLLEFVENRGYRPSPLSLFHSKTHTVVLKSALQSFDQERLSTPAKFFSEGLIVVVAGHTDQLKSVACS